MSESDTAFSCLYFEMTTCRIIKEDIKNNYHKINKIKMIQKYKRKFISALDLTPGYLNSVEIFYINFTLY